MDNFSFGISMTVVGMGGTLLSLWVLTLCINGLKKAFPEKADEKSGKEGGA